MRLYLLLCLISLPCLAQQLSQAEKENLSRSVGVEQAFRNPPKAKLIFSAVGTGESKGRQLVRYAISVKGLTGHGPYILMTWDIGTKAPIISMNRVVVDEAGVLRCDEKATDCPGAKTGSDIVIGVSGMIGQPRRFVLTGQDKMPIALGEVVPFPTVATDQNCTAEAVLMYPNGAAVLIIGHGFKPGEEVKFSSSSYGETIESPHTASSFGEVTTVVLPFVKGHDEGKTSISLSGADCRPATTFEWGTYHEVSSNKTIDK